MPFVNADYLLKTTQAEKISSLKLLIVEVTNLLNSPTSQQIDGLGYSRESLGLFRKDLLTELQLLEASVPNYSRNNVTFLKARCGKY